MKPLKHHHLFYRVLISFAFSMTLHSLPFHIDYNGEAEIDVAFPVYSTEKSDIVESAFRGRKLIGRIHELPAQFNRIL